MTFEAPKRGHRVRDKFKTPKPGDTVVEGVLEKVSDDSVTVRMDDGRERTMPRHVFLALFERLDE